MSHNNLPTAHITPLDSYLTKEIVAHAYESSDAIESTTSEIFSQWKAQSLPRHENLCRKVVFTIKTRDHRWGPERWPHHGEYGHACSWFDFGLERLEAIDMDKCTPEKPVPMGFIDQFHLESRDGSLKVPTLIACDIRSIRPAAIKYQEDPPAYRFNYPFSATGTRFQSRPTADPEVKEHVITWTSEDGINSDPSGGGLQEREGRGKLTGNGDFVRNLKVGDIITVWARCRFRGRTSEVKEVKIDVYWEV
jgi:hypothetical protein